MNSDRSQKRNLESSAMSSTSTCSLCLEVKPLCRSHSIPEFCYKKTYDEKRRGRLLSTESPKVMYLQKGMRERLLCTDCEQRIGRFEKYFKEYWFDNHVLPEKVDSNCIFINDADYKRFKLFHLSILWRAGVSRLKDFGSVCLGPYAEKLRKVVLTEEPGDEEEYPFWGQVIVNDFQMPEYGIVSCPYRSRLEKSHVYYLCYAGCEWVFIVTDHQGRGFGHTTIQRDGRMALLPVPIRDMNTVKLFMRDRRRT